MTRVSLQSDQLTVLINSTGGEITSIKNKTGVEFIWQANKAIWPRYAPVLFPIVGRLKDNTSFFKGRHIELNQHGFARDMEFNVVEKTKTSAVFELRSDPNTLNKYPFNFILQITYVVTGNHLSCNYKVINPSEEPIFFSIGGHPGFNCPLVANETFEDYYLEFEKPSVIQTKLVNGLRSREKKELALKQNRLFLSNQLFNDDALVFEHSQIQRISLCSSVSAHKITIACSGWPYFGIWSKTGCREFVCLEPWHGITDSVEVLEFDKKEGVKRLSASETFRCSFSIYLD